jgi:hypothetical protein
MSVYEDVEGAPLKIDGLLAVATGGLLALGVVFFFFKVLVPYALYDLHLFFREGSLMWGMVHTNLWLVFGPIGSLAGVLHKWWREEGVLQGGLDEWRLWRSR